jgi:hypothetical protein
MSTPDGISSDDWELVEQLVAGLYEARRTPEEARHHRSLMEYLDQLETRYGALPSILATRADFTDDNDAKKEQLLQRAYTLSIVRGDRVNALYVAHSLTTFYFDQSSDLGLMKEWLNRSSSWHLRSMMSGSSRNTNIFTRAPRT